MGILSHFRRNDHRDVEPCRRPLALPQAAAHQPAAAARLANRSTIGVFGIQKHLAERSSYDVRPSILVRTLTKPTRVDRYGNRWQYHSRSDHHSKVACWGIVFDLVRTCPLLNRHIAAAKIAFGINHEMHDFQHDRKKKLDLVLCTPASGRPAKRMLTLRSMVDGYQIELTSSEHGALAKLPLLAQAPVGSVLMALEAKACMTAHQRALPRLYDELNSSHLTVHGATDQAISAGFVMVNVAEEYLSPDLNKGNRATAAKWNTHHQPRDAALAVEKVRQIPRRSRTGLEGYDALAIVIVDCRNDGSPVRLVSQFPAPPAGDIYDYASMIDRLAHIYATRFKDFLQQEQLRKGALAFGEAKGGCPSDTPRR